MEEYYEGSLHNPWYRGTSAPAAKAPVNKRDNTNFTAAGEAACAELKTPPGHPTLVQSKSNTECYIAAVSNPIGELWGIISKKKDYRDALKDCRNAYDLCCCSDWLGYYLDTLS